MSSLKDAFEVLRNVDAGDASKHGPKPEPSPKATTHAEERSQVGKRRNPDYRQVSGWIHKDIKQRVAIRMLEQGRPQDFGLLMEELLEEWLQKSTG